MVSPSTSSVHRDTLLGLLDDACIVEVRPGFFIASRDGKVQLLSDGTRSTRSAVPSLQNSSHLAFLKASGGSSAGRKFQFVGSSRDFVLVRVQNGDLGGVKKKFAGIQLLHPRRSARIAAMRPAPELPDETRRLRSSARKSLRLDDNRMLTVIEEIDMNKFLLPSSLRSSSRFVARSNDNERVTWSPSTRFVDLTIECFERKKRDGFYA